MGKIRSALFIAASIAALALQLGCSHPSSDDDSDSSSSSKAAKQSVSSQSLYASMGSDSRGTCYAAALSTLGIGTVQDLQQLATAEGLDLSEGPRASVDAWPLEAFGFAAGSVAACRTL